MLSLYNQGYRYVMGMAGGLPGRWNCMSKARECIALHLLQLFEGQGMVQIFSCLNMWAGKRSSRGSQMFILFITSSLYLI